MDPITRLNAALEGRYRIESELGEGGMAKVYLADDLKHERKVALKVLKPELAAVVGAERFLAEIKTTANLQHPHILPLFDSGEADSFLFYVMPYVEGETLRDRLEREKQLPVDEAVRIATDVAEALHSAHEQGVIHRDIKPANILMSKGRPLVADFGIALAVAQAGGGRLTETGLSMGTPYYMSPEQASADREPTPASDVYSLGCVLYEMLVGEPPFVGSTAQAVLAKVLMGNAPAATESRASIPMNVDAAVRKALEKLPADRFGSTAVLAKALGDPAFTYGAAPGDGAAPHPWRRISAGLAATSLLLLSGFVWAVSRSTATSPEAVAQFEIELGNAGVLGSPGSGVDLTISEDGSVIVYRGPGPEGPQLWERTIEELEPRPIPGTTGRLNPSLSGDARRIAASGGGVRTLPRAGGPESLPIESTSNPVFGPDGMLYLRIAGTGSLWRVPAVGGEPEAFTDPVEGADVRYTDALPDGDGFIITLNRDQNLELSTIAVVGPEGGEVRELFGGAMARYSPSGHLIYTTPTGTLMAIAFDPKRLDVSGESVAVLEGIQVKVSSASQFAMSETGTLIYMRGDAGRSLDQLVIVNMDGSTEDILLSPRAFGSPRWAPDGRTVAYHDGPSGSRDIFTYDVDLGTTPRQLTFGGTNVFPVWSPDGTRLAFSSARAGTEGRDLFIKTLNDDSPAESMLSGLLHQDMRGWPSDNVIVYEGVAADAQSDLWIFGPESGEEPMPYLDSEADLDDIAVSPDGRWAVYQSDEAGTEQLFVRSFPEPRQQIRVTDRLAQFPRWSPDGRTIFYWGAEDLPSDTLFAAHVQTEPTFTVLSHEPVLIGPYFPEWWDLHPSGDRIIVARPLEDTGAGGFGNIVLVLNFDEELKRLVPN